MGWLTLRHRGQARSHIGSPMASRMGHLAFFPVGHAINLDLAVHHHVGLYTGTRRGVFRGEVFAEYLVETPEVPWVFQPYTHAHHVFEFVAGLFQNRHHIAQGLAGLLDDAAVDDFTVHRWHLARDVEPAVRFHRAGERTWLATAGGAAGAVTSNGHNVAPD